MTDFNAFDRRLLAAEQSTEKTRPDGRPADRRVAMRVLVPGAVDVVHAGRSVVGYAVNLSYGGIRLLLDGLFAGATGDAIEVALPALELKLAGTVVGFVDTTGHEVRVEWVNCTALDRAVLASAVCVQMTGQLGNS
jgi:hypothetical protein